MKLTKIVLGILAGVAGGAILGILFAPEKGSRTRRNIAINSNDYADDMKQSIEDFVDSLSKKFKDVLQETEKTIRCQKANYESEEKEMDKKTA